MPTQFICLEKTYHQTLHQDPSSLDLHIISARSLNLSVNPKIHTIVIVHTGKNTCEAYDFYQNKQNKLKTEKNETGFLINWPENIHTEISSQFILHTIQNEYSVNPIWDERSAKTGKHLLSIPAYGLIANTWCDGWMTHFSKHGDVLSLIPPGTQSRLYIPVKDADAVGLKWKEALAELPSLENIQHLCVLDSLKEQIHIEDLNSVYIAEFNLLTACKLLLLRQAFPKHEIEVLHKSPKKEWPARFKNFLESIRATWKQGAESISIEFNGISDENILSLAPLLNQKTKILEGIKR